MGLVEFITKLFGNKSQKDMREIMPYVEAFGDFNSDELTDVFLIRDNMQVLQILYGKKNLFHFLGIKLNYDVKINIFPGADTEPLLRNDDHFCSYDYHQITSVVPGDFDGDALMDLINTKINITIKMQS